MSTPYNQPHALHMHFLETNQLKGQSYFYVTLFIQRYLTIIMPGKSHGRRNLEGCSPWGRWGSDTTEWLHFHFSLSCIGEGNGNPLQCSCLENPRDRGAWWAAVYGVAQSQTQLKWLSSSSSKVKWDLYQCKPNPAHNVLTFQILLDYFQELILCVGFLCLWITNEINL